MSYSTRLIYPQADALRAGSGVIDVAGGSGDLAYELSYMFGIQTITVDPRAPKLSLQQRRQLEYVHALEVLLA